MKIETLLLLGGAAYLAYRAGQGTISPLEMPAAVAPPIVIERTQYVDTYPWWGWRRPVGPGPWRPHRRPTPPATPTSTTSSPTTIARRASMHGYHPTRGTR